MMNISYINNYDNQTLTFSSQVTGFEATNVQAIHLSIYWKTTSNTGQWLVANGTMTPECAYVYSTNLTDDAVVKIQGNDTDSWSSPNVDITLVKGDNNTWSTTKTMTQQDYWRFYIDDPTNAVDYIEIGRVSLGPLLQVEGPFIKFKENQIDTSATTLSISGQVYADIGYKFKSYSLTYPWWNATEKDGVTAFADTVHKSQPFFISFGEIGPLYCILTNNLEFDHIMDQSIWSSRLDFVQTF